MIPVLKSNLEILNELRNEHWNISKDDKEALAFIEILQEYGLVEKGETDPVKLLMKKMGYFKTD
jgi:hypothetical protein